MYFVYELYFTVLSLLSIYTFCLADIHAENKKHWFSIIHLNAMDSGRISRIYSYTKQKRVE